MVTRAPFSDRQERRGHWPVFTTMIAIAVTPAAHQAIKASLLGTADATPRPGPDGLIRVWLDRKFVDRLAQMRGHGESYSDVILRLVKTGSSADRG
jgi:hypothetical protein